MSQQLAILVIVDIASALKGGTLKNNTYMFDNMSLLGSEGEGTADLVTAIHGTYYSDGTQAAEQVINWLPLSLGSIPATVPRTYFSDRERRSDQEALNALKDLARTAAAADTSTDVVATLNRLHQGIGTKAKRTTPRRPGDMHAGGKLIDITGEFIHAESEGSTHAVNNPAPVITDIAGEAVEKKIIFPAQYGSPDLLSDGWYWSATVDTSRPGRYAYTMTMHLHELVNRNGEWVWEEVTMRHESYIKIHTRPMRNGFTKAGIGMLPII